MSKYVYAVSVVDGFVYFSSWKKATDFLKQLGYTECDYTSEWVREFSCLEEVPFRAPTHTTIYKEEVTCHRAWTRHVHIRQEQQRLFYGKCREALTV